MGIEFDQWSIRAINAIIRTKNRIWEKGSESVACFLSSSPSNGIPAEQYPVTAPEITTSEQQPQAVPSESAEQLYTLVVRDS